MKQSKVRGKIFKITLVCLMIGAVFNALNIPVQAAPLTYDKNTILCDHDFDFANTLSEAEIQAIFDSRKIVEALGEVEDGEVLVLPLTGNLLEKFGSTPIQGEDVVSILKKVKK